MECSKIVIIVIQLTSKHTGRVKTLGLTISQNACVQLVGPGSDNLWQIQRIAFSSRTNNSHEHRKSEYHLLVCALRGLDEVHSEWSIMTAHIRVCLSEMCILDDIFHASHCTHSVLKKPNTGIKWSLGLMEWGGGKTTACKVRKPVFEYLRLPLK